MATFAYLHPRYTFPEILEPGAPVALGARELGHPLLPEAGKVCNDFTIPHLGWVAIITGSNMAGKSVFLKTVGANLALAYAGGPVNARALQAVPFRLFASMGVSDSVTDGISFFYAEVKRLKALLAALEAQDPWPLLFLIDETFRGTNNRERLIGSQAYVQALVGKHGAGLIATHSVTRWSAGESVGESTAQSGGQAAGQLAGQLALDYVLRPGPCPTTNALKIMELEGLPVPQEVADS